MRINRKKNSITLLYAIILCSLFTAQMPIAIYAQEDSEIQMKELELNKPLNGEISEANEEDWYRFNATEGSSYVIEVYNQSVSMDAFFTLYTANESIISWSYSKITHNFTETGTYLVKVSHADSKYGVGTYSILLRPARPPSMVVNIFDTSLFDPVKDATVKVYNPLRYTLLGENLTLADGQTIIQLSTRGYYLVTVTADGYNDLYGVTALLDEGPNVRWGGLTPIEYTGFIVSSALVEEIVVPGESNFVTVSIYNANTTYPITLTNITVHLPWYGFYGGVLQGEITVTEGMPLTIPPNTLLTTAIPFTAPSDITAYLGSFAAPSYVDFNAQAPAWRTTFEVVEGVGLIENRSLTTVTIHPELQASQGFRTPIVGVSLIPTTDPLANQKLEEVSVNIQDLSSQLEEVSLSLEEVIFRVGEVNAELFTTSSTLKRITSILDDTNMKLDEVSSKLSSSENKLASISSGLTATNGKLDSVTSELETVNRAVSTLSSQQRETNSKLDNIDEQLIATREETETLLTTLFEDLRTLLLGIIGVAAVIAAVNIIHLTKTLRPRA